MSRIPPHLAQAKKALALGTWVTGKKFDRELYFKEIDRFKQIIGANPEGGENTLRWMVAGLLDRDGEFYEYVTSKDTYEIDSPEAWFKVCTAGAETIIHEYEKAGGLNR